MARPKEIFKKRKKKIKRIPFYENHKVWTSVSIKFYWTQPCSFAYILSTAVFLLQQQRWVVATKTICTLKPKIFLSGPSQKKKFTHLWYKQTAAEIPYQKNTPAEITLPLPCLHPIPHTASGQKSCSINKLQILPENFTEYTPFFTLWFCWTESHLSSVQRREKEGRCK